MRLLVALFVGAAVGRYLGTDKFGTYSAVLSLCTLLALGSDLGIARVVVRDLVSGQQVPGALMGTAVAIRVGGAVCMAVVTILALPLIHGTHAEVPIILGLMFATGFLLKSIDVLDLGFQAVTDGKYPAVARMIGLLAGALLQLWLIRHAAEVQAFGVAFVLEGILTCISMSIVWWKFGSAAYKKWELDPIIAKGILAESWPMFVATLYSLISSRIDVILLEKMAGSSKAGIYSASARIYEILIGVLPLLGVSLFPTLTQWYQKDKAVFTRRYTQLTQWITWAGAAGLLLTWSLRHHIFRHIFGPDFSDAANVLPWHLASALVMYHSIFRAAYLTLAHRQVLLLWTSLLGAIVNVSLNLVLIPQLGARGAAIAGTMTQITTLILSNVISHDTRWILKVSAKTLLLPARRFSCP